MNKKLLIEIAEYLVNLENGHLSCCSFFVSEEDSMKESNKILDGIFEKAKLED